MDVSRADAQQAWMRPTWRQRAAALLAGVFAGSGVLILRSLAWGNADPFLDDPPYYLYLGAFVATLLIGWSSGAPFTTALGFYAGLMAYLFLAARPEYPVSSCLALAVHGLAPAIIGALAVLLGRWCSRSPAPE